MGEPNLQTYVCISTGGCAGCDQRDGEPSTEPVLTHPRCQCDWDVVCFDDSEYAADYREAIVEYENWVRIHCELLEKIQKNLDRIESMTNFYHEFTQKRDELEMEIEEEFTSGPLAEATQALDALAVELNEIHDQIEDLMKIEDPVKRTERREELHSLRTEITEKIKYQIENIAEIHEEMEAAKKAKTEYYVHRIPTALRIIEENKEELLQNREELQEAQKGMEEAEAAIQVLENDAVSWYDNP